MGANLERRHGAEAPRDIVGEAVGTKVAGNAVGEAVGLALVCGADAWLSESQRLGSMRASRLGWWWSLIMSGWWQWVSDSMESK